MKLNAKEIPNPIDGPGKYRLANGQEAELKEKDLYLSFYYEPLDTDLLYNNNQVEPETGHQSVWDCSLDVMEKIQ